MFPRNKKTKQDDAWNPVTSHEDRKEFDRGVDASRTEQDKKPLRSDVSNFLLSTFERETSYLEIGVRNPEDNFEKIVASKKYSVDPGVEFEDNPVDFPVTSDAFFAGLESGEFLSRAQRFDVIFVDGLHLAEQVDRDIVNSLKFLRPDGFVVLHDCNPPTEWHARESYSFKMTPAKGCWNGTVWKAFLKWRAAEHLWSCCIDTDWGVGVISPGVNVGAPRRSENPFYEYNVLDRDRAEALGLVSFSEFCNRVESS